jgi:hypothetical protein
MVGGSIEESGRLLWIAEHGQPLAKARLVVQRFKVRPTRRD